MRRRRLLPGGMEAAVDRHERQRAGQGQPQVGGIVGGHGVAAGEGGDFRLEGRHVFDVEAQVGVELQRQRRGERGLATLLDDADVGQLVGQQRRGAERRLADACERRFIPGFEEQDRGQRAGINDDHRDRGRRGSVPRTRRASR